MHTLTAAEHSQTTLIMFQEKVPHSLAQNHSGFLLLE
jgi:hypothetical protein